ncbi:hypothetical protein EXIGLDRAFT_564748, partial [Exidia glandulosa HHB12029]
AKSLQERSSELRKTRFKKIQEDRGVAEPRDLLRNMPIRWSSTKIMLDRAIAHCEDIKQFIRELEHEETKEEKHDTLHTMHIRPAEWLNVSMLLELLSFADDTQIAFSAEKYPTLYFSSDRLLTLTSAWKKRRDDLSLSEFKDALDIALEKLEEYHDISSNSSGHPATLLLSPSTLSARFTCSWARERQTGIIKPNLDGTLSPTSPSLSDVGPRPSTSQKAGLNRLRADAACSSTAPAASSTAAELWRAEYDCFLNTHYDVPEDMSLLRWWGMYAAQLPTWASFGADYLAIMSSSISAEWAFSSAGLTITKHRNRLKGDIVEALQVIKCTLRNDLLVHEQPPSSIVDADLLCEDSDEEDG